MIGLRQEISNNSISAEYNPCVISTDEAIEEQIKNTFKELANAYTEYIVKELKHLQEEKFCIPINKVCMRVEITFNKPNETTSTNGIVTDIEVGKYFKEIVILFIAAETDRDNLINIEEDLQCIKDSVAENTRIKVESCLNEKPTKIAEAISILHPCVLHLDGHGSPGEFYMMGDEGSKPEGVPPESLSKLFESMKDELRLAIFDFCTSHFHADIAINYIEFAIGTLDAVNIEVARTFMGQFYKSYAHNNSLSQSFLQAQSAVQLKYGATAFKFAEQNKLFKLFSSTGSDPKQFFLSTEDK